MFVCFCYYLLFPQKVGEKIIGVTVTLETTEALDLASHFPGSTGQGNISFATHYNLSYCVSRWTYLGFAESSKTVTSSWSGYQKLSVYVWLWLEMVV